MAEKPKEHFHEKPLLWIANPLQVYEESGSATPGVNHQREVEAANKNTHLVSDSNVELIPPIRLRLRSREESGPAELFYDLFFAATFGSFTESHNISTPEALTGYVGFFCLLWTTWMNVGLYDVRLERDSVVDRVAKAAQFIVLAGFALVGTTYDVSSFTDVNTLRFFQTEAQSLSLILMMSRWILCLQYLSSAWFARPDFKMWAPCSVISACYAVTACLYLGIAFVLPHRAHAAYDSYVAWFVLAVLEVLVNIVASCYWHHMNFKNTHLVERMSLLTLIILGEGVIVLFESVTGAFQAGSALTQLAPPTLAATFLLYFIYMHYFDNLPETHFGTIIEPIWASLHFPFHLAIVVAAVGSRFFLSFSLATQSLSSPSYIWNSTLGWNLTNFPAQACYNISRENITGVEVTVEGYTIYDSYKEYDVASGDSSYEGYGEINTEDPLLSYNETCALAQLKAINVSLADNITGFQALNASVYQLITDDSVANPDSRALENMRTWIQQVQSAGVSVDALHLATTSALQIMSGALSITFNAFDLDPPALNSKKDVTDKSKTLSPRDYMDQLSSLYDFVYRYFFTSCGCLLLILGIMALLSKGKVKRRFLRREPDTDAEDEEEEQQERMLERHWSVWDYLRWSSFISAGVCLVVLGANIRALESQTIVGPADGPFLLFPHIVYVIPIATLVFFVVVIVQHIPFERIMPTIGRTSNGGDGTTMRHRYYV